MPRFLSAIQNRLIAWWRQPPRRRLVQGAIALVAAGAVAVGLLFAYALLVVAPGLPAIDALTSYRPKIPLRVYTADNVLIGEFGEERRDFVPIKEMPANMKNAIVAIEDAGFYEHGGVDFSGIVRAGLANLTRSRSQGASTITMQVARTFLLTRQKTYSRKIQEILLAYRIEDELSKDQILELYMNQIYLGERAYGFGTAARVYFGKPVKDLSIAESAMLAGLPKAPATANPVVNPKRAIQRQQYILKRMRDLDYITAEQYTRAAAETLKVQGQGKRFPTHAEYAAELVRQYMVSQYKDETYTAGYVVHTTLRKIDQDAAYTALRRGVMDYERRHGYSGPEGSVTLRDNDDERQDQIEATLQQHPDSDDLQAAVVLEASPKLVRAQLRSGDVIDVSGEGLRFAAAALSAKAAPDKRIRPGAVIRVMENRGKWGIFHLPEVAAAFVSLNAQDGSIRSLVGGYDFVLNKFDHVTQAWRQPGSTIKPFVYSAAIEKGFSPSTLVNDAPLEEEAPVNGQPAWNPGNDDGNYDGPVTMRTGLKRSKNLVSIRILREITPETARQHLGQFGFDVSKQPANLTLTLGTGSVTPLQMAGAYAVFSNGGFKVAPYLIKTVHDAKGTLLLEARGPIAGDETARVLDPRNAFLMDSMMRDVVRSGTAYSAGQKLGRRDLAGKTGTTNDALDGWFGGYSGDVVAVTWMGYDQPKSLGGREYGGTLALPIWVDYMREARRGQPEAARPVPPGLTQVDGDWMYDEYVNGGGVRSIGVEEPQGGSFWDRLFNRPAAPSAPAVRTPQEQKDFEELYRGN